ncbi:hypothetical protein ACIBSW_39710 [Actinoplanes sp. NPDC049668]|uniref:hypothetical protein n=1 Tax=unclassified Actinoplanes TaxID=2626549 RepID=UPI0033A0AD62
MPCRNPAITVNPDPAASDGRQAVCGGCQQPYFGDRCLTCRRCARCRVLAAEHDTATTVRGSTICLSCRDCYYWQCSSCEGWNRDSDRCGNSCVCYCGNCDDCDDRASDFRGLVHDYAYRPRPVFYGRGPLFLGPEIELEIIGGDGYRCAEIASEALEGLGYLKHDGSLSAGFEMVGHPMAYDWAIENFPWPMLAELRRHGAEATDATGIHVHVSRAGFSSVPHTYRWMKFIYRNETDVVRLARRQAPSWAAFRPEDRRAVKHYVKGQGYGDRYRAINTNNPDTLELRVFAGSLDPDVIKAAFAFAAASVEYTRTLTIPDISVGGWAWPTFTGWLAERPQYAPLTRELEALSCAC